MYIEKNVCYSIIETLLNIPVKTIAARLDVMEMSMAKKDSPSKVGERRTY